MCGIVYAQSFDGSPVNKLILKQFEAQRNRGTEGFGFFDGKYTLKASMEKRIKHLLKRRKNRSDLILFHHRYPTSTVNEKKAAHPFNTGDYFGDTKYVLVHNGVIRNSKDLKKAHEELDVKYQSVLNDGKFNDSESLLWDFALTIEGKQENMKAWGDMAFICIKVESGKPSKMYFGRNQGRPLKMKRDKQGIMLSSAGEGEEIKSHTLYTYNYSTKRTSNKYFRIPSWNEDAYSKNWGSYNSKYDSSSNSNENNNYCGYSGNSNSHNFDDEYFDDFGRFSPTDTVYYSEDGRGYIPYNEGILWEDGTYDYWSDEEERWASQPPEITRENVGEQLELVTSILKRHNPLEPTKEQIQSKIWEALLQADGNYNSAYWFLEYRLEDIDVTEPKDVPMRRELKLLEACVSEFETNYLQYAKDTLHPFWRDNKQAGSTAVKEAMKLLEMEKRIVA